MVPEEEVWSLVEFPKVSPGVRSMFLLARCECTKAGQHCPERQACPVGGGWDLIEQEPLEERRGGMRPVHQVGGRAHSSYRARTGNHSVIKSGDIIYHAGPFLQT